VGAGDTSGPLNFFCLIPAGWLAGWDSFLAIRICALLALAACLTLVHQCLALVYPPRTVRLATFSAAVLEALTNSVDLQHFSSELLSLVWLSVAAYAALRRWVYRGGPLWSGLGGLMLGAVPMSKLQPAPLAFCAGLYWLWAEFRHRGPETLRHRNYLMIGAVLPTLLFVLPVLIAGQWDNFVNSFLRFNLGYAAAGDTSPVRWLEGMLAKSREQDSLLHLWLPGMILWCALAFRAHAIGDRIARRFTFLALTATVLATFCVVRAGRPFLHYWQLVIPALTLLLGALLGNLAAAPAGAAKSDRGLMAAAALALVLTLGGHRLVKPSFFVGAFTYFEAHPRNPISDHILAHARPGDAIAIWGWSNYIYVETGLRQSTQDAEIERSVRPGPLQQFFRERFLADLMVTRPALFVDSVGPCSIYFQAPALKHDRNFPELGAVIRADYVLVDEVDGAQIYRRRDRVAR